MCDPPQNGSRLVTLEQSRAKTAISLKSAKVDVTVNHVNQWKKSSDLPINYPYTVYLYKSCIKKATCIPGGVGFLPSTVPLRRKSLYLNCLSLRLLENYMLGPSCLNCCGFRYSMCVCGLETQTLKNYQNPSLCTSWFWRLWLPKTSANSIDQLRCTITSSLTPLASSILMTKSSTSLESRTPW